jgi:hypothetical protein
MKSTRTEVIKTPYELFNGWLAARLRETTQNLSLVEAS